MVKMMLNVKVKISNPIRMKSIFTSSLGIATSRAFWVIMGENNPVMPPIALKVKANTIFPAYFFIYTNALNR